MNQKLRALDIEKIIFWDLETVREFEELDPKSEAYTLYEQKTRNRETDEVLTEPEVLEHYKKRAALSPTHNKIVCLSMAFVLNNVIYMKSITGTQKEIIQQFSVVLSKGYIPAGWNIVGYDFPILRQKAFQEGVLDYAPEKFCDAGKKEWAITEIKYEINIIDLMLMHKGTYFYNQSLAEACYLAGIPSPKTAEIDGSQVSEIYYNEGIERIIPYCEADVLSCVHLFQKMRGEQLITEVVYKRDGTPEENPPLLTKLYNTKMFTEDIKQELRDKKIAKKDKSTVQKLVLAHYLESVDVMAQNKKELKEINEQRTKEIIEFFKTL